MTQSNRDRVGRALETLNAGLLPFVEREMQAKYGSRWMQIAAAGLHDFQAANLHKDDATLDTQVLLSIMWNQWNSVFSTVLGRDERSWVSELRTMRNRWAHQEAFNTDDTYRVFDNIQRLLNAVSAFAEASEIDRQKQELMRIRYEEQARSEKRKQGTGPLVTTSSSHSGLSPWREVISPHPDVASGRYNMAEFAANLAQVRRGGGEDDYRDPRTFFTRTFLTYGLRHLLANALRRLSGQDGDPIVQLQTNFGGGKTHSLLALYHLFSGTPLADLEGIESICQATGIYKAPDVRRAVLIGYELSPAMSNMNDDGIVTNTLWGELARQLLGSEGYAMVAEADRRGVSPGSGVLRELFLKAGPSLILIDEWVVYVRQLYNNSNLPAGSFDANLSFAQALTEAVRESPQVLLVASIPASDTEYGGEGGHEAVVRLKNIFGRMEATWRPADADEGFEIVRRRLFLPIADSHLYAVRDGVAKTFAEYYRSQPQEFPAACREAEYERRICAAYPIHPELFDRLYNDWSSDERFQRTRGVLRLMSAVIHNLWEQEDKSPLILPSSMPLGNDTVRLHLIRHLEDNWTPIIERDVDGPNSLPLNLDNSNANLGRYWACRRSARTIFMGTAPNSRSANRGISANQIKLGCAIPGESVAVFGDALRHLSNTLTHLYVDDQKYWYSTNPNVTRTAQERAEIVKEDEILLEIEQRLRSEMQPNHRGEFGRVHVCPSSGADIPEDDQVRLVILKPQYTHGARDQKSDAWKESFNILNTRGNANRHLRNTLVFLAADRTRLNDLKQTVRLYKAWKSIHEDETLNLDAFQRKQAQSKFADAQKRVEALIPETFIWLLSPYQEDPQRTDTLTLQESKLAPQPGPISPNASRKLVRDGGLVTTFAPELLRSSMDDIPLWSGNHINLKTLADNFAHYIYLPRLKNSDVLLQAVREGVQNPTNVRDTFAYAERWDESNHRYLGLKIQQPITPLLNSEAVLVKPDVALEQLRQDEEKERQAKKIAEKKAPYSVGSGQGSVDIPAPEHSRTSTGSVERPKPPYHAPVPQPPIDTKPKARRFHGSVDVRPLMMSIDAGTIMDEIVTHLAQLDQQGVRVTIEIQANIDKGIPDDIVRDILENSRNLKFQSYGFEED
ncbi:Swt1 family HEPN domain-containing protein [Dictyobacter formicarum]|uniref:Swt1-like HEPN domain-containing protein n=1 Tax=Dictyobacter formicarum TaxID=2778368 RepID=A0ABQ3VP61_9CHLR|nr:Swt1 family HEPN domain-containing protein [Dictyobacter formicarum]GHO88025.1 hypothetical protein KSZ_60310 [Dictyobacter formicarum]